MTSVRERESTKVEANDEKKRPQSNFKFQGVRKHLDILREYNDKIHAAEDKIQELKERVTQRIEEFRKSTGQKELFDAKDEIQKRIEVLQKEKNAAHNDLKQAGQELRALSQAVGEEKKKLNMKSTTELKNRLEAIENRIREKPLSSKEEKEISSEKNRLIKLLSMQDIFREKDEKIKEMEEQKKSKESALTVKKQELDHQFAKLTEVNNKIGKIKKTAYPEEIKKMQETQNALIEEKKSIIEKKKEELAVMEKKAQEYKLKSAEIEKAKEQKNALVAQEKIVQDLSEKRNHLEESLQKNTGDQLKVLKSTLEMHIKVLSQAGKSQVALPFNVVSQLLTYGVEIPSTVEKVKKAIQVIEKKAAEEEKTFLSQREKILSQIEEAAKEVKKEQAKLEKMPRPVFPRFDE